GKGPAGRDGAVLEPLDVQASLAGAGGRPAAGAPRGETGQPVTESSEPGGSLHRRGPFGKVGLRNKGLPPGAQAERPGDVGERDQAITVWSPAFPGPAACSGCRAIPPPRRGSALARRSKGSRTAGYTPSRPRPWRTSRGRCPSRRVASGPSPGKRH